jgi:hypothetical protein
MLPAGQAATMKEQRCLGPTGLTLLGPPNKVEWLEAAAAAVPAAEAPAAVLGLLPWAYAGMTVNILNLYMFASYG